MDFKPSGKFNRRCSKCDKLVHTGAKKSFKCPHCGSRTYITHTKPLKPYEKKTYMKKGLDQCREPDRR